MTGRPSIRGRLRQMAATGLRSLADSVLDVADLLDGDGDEGATDTDANDANDADSDGANTRDPIAVALKGCVEIPHPLPKVMKDLNRHYAALQIEGFVGAWRRTNGKIHIAFAAHDEALLDHLNRHLGQAIAGTYE